MPLLIEGARVCAAEGVWAPGWLLTEGTLIAALGPGEAPAAVVDADRIDGSGATLLPGFIDLHVHGGNGAEAMDGEVDGLQSMARFHATHGVTAILPTTWTASEATTRAALEAIAAATGPVEGGATILGAHLEGPWINPARCGAQDPALIRPPDPAEAKRLLDAGAGGGSGVIRMVALAPELDGAHRLIGECRERGVAVAAGHTEAGFEAMTEAVRLGVRHVTHTFNAMGGFGHREPGTAGAALALPELRCELIADGVHVHPGAMAVLARAKGPDGVVLVSDATRAAGLPEGPVELGGRAAYQRNGAVRLADGTLAGSALTLDVALRRFAAASGWGWEHLWRAAAGNAAAALGLATKGRLAPGADADLVLLDAGGAVCLTVVEGRIVYRH
jgi:N-acetylglucosamine-6-phosphate deacetylase